MTSFFFYPHSNHWHLEATKNSGKTVLSYLCLHGVLSVFAQTSPMAGSFLGGASIFFSDLLLPKSNPATTVRTKHSLILLFFSAEPEFCSDSAKRERARDRQRQTYRRTEGGEGRYLSRTGFQIGGKGGRRIGNWLVGFS